jgi:hypothetical protein
MQLIEGAGAAAAETALEFTTAMTSVRQMPSASSM